MNNLSSSCGLVHAKVRASDKDLPVSELDEDVGDVDGEELLKLSSLSTEGNVTSKLPPPGRPDFLGLPSMS